MAIANFTHAVSDGLRLVECGPNSSIGLADSAEIRSCLAALKISLTCLTVTTDTTKVLVGPCASIECSFGARIGAWPNVRADLDNSLADSLRPVLGSVSSRLAHDRA